MDLSKIKLKNKSVVVSEIFLVFSLFLSGCGMLGSGSQIDSSSNSPQPAHGVEAAYCTVNSTLSGLILNGSAHYEQLYPSAVDGANGLDAKRNKPIRFAEVMVFDGSGKLVQCGETDNFGNYSIPINKVSANVTYTVQVNSRAYNDHVKASILNDIYAKAYYSVTNTVALTASMTTATVTDILAPSTGVLQAGAFNILEQILLTNEYIRTHSTDTSCTLCVAFTVAPKVPVYWKPGFTPEAYVGSPYSAISFFDWSGSIDATPGLYILGGIAGDVVSADTDHFDNSVIIHEYGHFLEHTFAKTDSPGGSHNGNAVIDPRLAWSEGYADFLPSAVTGSTYYIDTYGGFNSNNNGGVNISINLEIADGHDNIRDTGRIGEGIYRELSISRALLDYIDSNSDQIVVPFAATTPLPTVAETSQLNFAYLWAAMTNDQYGLKNPNLHFRSMGHFNQGLETVLNLSFGATPTYTPAPVAAFEKVRLAEYQTADTTEYSQELKTLSGNTCTRTINPVDDQLFQRPNPNNPSGPYIDYLIPNIFDSSRLYSYYHPGGSFNLTMEYTTDATSPTDLDLYLYYEHYVFGDSTSMAGSSVTFRSMEHPTGTESIAIASLPAGYYMINVRALVKSPPAYGSNVYQPAQFNLKMGGQYLCP